jgi:hypothetical protein
MIASGFSGRHLMHEITPPEDAMVAERIGHLFKGASLLIAVLLVSATLTRIQGAEKHSIPKVDFPSVELPPRPVSVGKAIPLVMHGVALGTAVVYSDSDAGRPNDYLEFYNDAGNLIAVVWFDRFGIRRAAVDRSFLDGKDHVEGVFVSVFDGDFI